MKVRRTAGAAAVVVLAAGLGLHPVAAEAVTATATGDIHTGRTMQVSSGACAVDVDENPLTVALAANGVWKSIASSGSGRMAQYQAQASTTSKARLAVDSRGAARADLVVKGTARMTPTGVSDSCTVAYGLGGAVEAEVGIPVRSWVALRTTTVSSRGEVVSYLEAANQARTVRVIGELGHPATQLVAAGTYDLALYAIPKAVSAGPTTVRTSSFDGRASIAFVPIGTRRTHTGNGIGFISVGHRSCSQNLVRATFTAAARTKLRSATFQLDGRTVVTLRGTQLQRSSLALRSVPRTSSGKVVVSMVTKAGARRTTTSTSWPCA